MNVDSLLLRRSLPLLLYLLAALCIACDDAVTPDEPPRISITQPADSALVTDSIVRITTEVMVKCGCNSHVEFRIDGEHVYSDYFPYFSFDWNTTDYEKGWHSIATRLVVRDVGEAWDSIAVFVSRGDSLRDASAKHFLKRYSDLPRAFCNISSSSVVYLVMRLLICGRTDNDNR